MRAITNLFHFIVTLAIMGLLSWWSYFCFVSGYKASQATGIEGFVTKMLIEHVTQHSKEEVSQEEEGEDDSASSPLDWAITNLLELISEEEE